VTGGGARAAGRQRKQGERWTLNELIEEFGSGMAAFKADGGDALPLAERGPNTAQWYCPAAPRPGRPPGLPSGTLCSLR
jgi:hypothetical protein